MKKDWRTVLREERIGERVHLCDLPGGVKVHRQGRSLIVMPPNAAVLSSANFNGGVFEGPDAVMNTTGLGGDAEASMMEGGHAVHAEYYAECARKIGFDPARIVGLGTAVTMDKAAIVTKTSGRTSVSAIVTAGVEGNGGRAGDPASYDQLEGYKGRNGTIVIILLIDADLPEASMARAMITATEAKTCALQQLMAASLYSTGIASGSGTDQVAVVCNRGSGIHLTDAGKHSLLGELIGRCVMEGVLRALDNWAGLTPLSQRNALRRLKRYRVGTEEFLQHAAGADRDAFLGSLEETAADGEVVAAAAAAIHIQDEIGWGLLDSAEGRRAGNILIQGAMVRRCGACPERLDLEGDLIGNLVRALSLMALCGCAGKGGSA